MNNTFFARANKILDEMSNEQLAEALSSSGFEFTTKKQITQSRNKREGWFCGKFPMLGIGCRLTRSKFKIFTLKFNKCRVTYNPVVQNFGEW